MSDEYRRTIFLVGPAQRQFARDCITSAPDDYVVEIRKKTRSIIQNSRLWAMLADISRQVDWYGRKLSPESWKHVFSSALKKQEVVPGLNGDFVVLGQSTSRMTVSEMRDMQDLMSAFGADHDVQWSEPEKPEDEEYMRRYA
jgi:hypothetical protein